MVGIAAGIPAPHDPANHVRLGDDVVSSGQGVVQYDLTKRHPDSTLEVRSILPPPSTLLLGAVRGLEVGRLSGRRPWEAYIAGAKAEWPSSLGSIYCWSLGHCRAPIR